MINGVNVIPPSLKSLLDSVKADIFQSMNCVKIGRISTFDPAKRTAEIKLAFKRTLSIPLADGTRVVDSLLLVDCPVVTLQGGGGVLGFPIAAGDECLVLFSDSNIDNWFTSGGDSVPFDGRRHDFSDGIAIVGLNSLARPLVKALADDEIGLADALAKVAIKNGKITLANATKNFITSMDAFLTAVSSDSALNPATKTAATTLKTDLDLLFY